jgi:ribosomal protein S18 acetylase RimI-like enzyme
LSAAGEAALGAILEGEAPARCWIVRQAGAPIGYLVLTLGYSIEHGGRDGFIDDLYLVPQARGAGRGKALLEFALAEARRLGIRTLHLEVEPDNPRATRLYRKRGFAETGRRLMSLALR